MLKHRPFSHLFKVIPTMERKLSLLLLGIDWINGSNNQQSYSCVMSCPTSHLGLTEINDGETIVCSIPVTMKGPEEIVPIDLNLSNDHQATLTRIVKVISSLSLSSICLSNLFSRIFKPNIIRLDHSISAFSFSPLSFCFFSSTPFLARGLFFSSS